MSFGHANANYQPPAHQQAVDDLFAAARANPAVGRPPLFKPPPPRLQPSQNLLDQRLTEELEMVRRQLEQIGGILTNDPFLLQRHSGSLQAIDLINQILGHVATVVNTEDKEAAVDEISLQDLKARLQRRPLRAIGSE